MSGPVRIGLLVFVALSVSLPACSTSTTIRKADQPPKTPVKETVAETILEVSFGISAPFSQSRITIDAAGNLSYTAEVYPPAVSEPKMDSETVMLTDDQLKALHQLLSGSKVFGFGDRYNIQGQDCISHGVSVKTDKGVKSFGCQCGCPDEMNTIQAKIEELLGHPMVIMGM